MSHQLITRRGSIKQIIKVCTMPLVLLKAAENLNAQSFRLQQQIASAGVAAIGGGGAAVAFDAHFEKGVNATAGPFVFVSNAGTVTGTIASNANRFLVIFVGFNATDPSLTAVTWNGVAATLIGSRMTFSSKYALSLYGLINPDTGNQTLSATWTGGSAGIWLAGLSLYNVSQSSPTQNSGSDTGTGTSASSVITTANGNMAVACGVNDNASSTTTTAGTEDWTDTNFDGNAAAGRVASTTTSSTITWTLGNSQAWGNIKCDVVKA